MAQYLKFHIKYCSCYYYRKDNETDNNDDDDDDDDDNDDNTMDVLHYLRLKC